MPQKRKKKTKNFSITILTAIGGIIGTLVTAFLTGIMNPYIDVINSILHPTSATVEGQVFNNNTPMPDVIVRIDEKFEDKTRDGGTFIIKGLNDELHFIGILTLENDLLYCDKFGIPPGLKYYKMEKDIKINEAPKTQSKIEEACTSNIFEFEKQQAKYKVNLMYAEEESKTNPNLRDVFVWINSSSSILPLIDRVTYYLHPTFSPNVITLYQNDKLKLSSNTYHFFLPLKAYGQFQMYAKVYFKDQQIKDFIANIVFH